MDDTAFEVYDLAFAWSGRFDQESFLIGALVIWCFCLFSCFDRLVKPLAVCCLARVLHLLLCTRELCSAGVATERQHSWILWL